MDQQLKAAVEAELAKKGLIKTEGAEADLLIGYRVAFREPKEWSAFTEMPGIGAGIVRDGGRRWDWDPLVHPIGTTTTTETLQIGNFGLDMYDAAKRELVWRGDAAKTFEANTTPEKRKKNIEKGVAKLLKNYPPKKRSSERYLNRSLEDLAPCNNRSGAFRQTASIRCNRGAQVADLRWRRRLAYSWHSQGLGWDSSAFFLKRFSSGLLFHVSGGGSDHVRSDRTHSHRGHRDRGVVPGLARVAHRSDARAARTGLNVRRGGKNGDRWNRR